MRIVIAFIIVFGLGLKSQEQDILKNLLGSWQLVEEFSDDDDEDLPSIMAVPESEKSEDVDEVRDVKLHFSEPNGLKTFDSGYEEVTTFEVTGSKIRLGNRDYQVKKLTKKKLILEELGDDLSLSIQTLVFEKVEQ